MPMTTRLRSGAGKRKNYRKLAGMKTRRPRGVNTVTVRGALGIPDRMVTKLEYRVARTMSSPYGVIDKVDYNLNSIYDPEAALGGHQPFWTDQYAALYNKYRVFNCKYEIKLCAIASNGTPIRVVCLSSAAPVGTLPTDVATAWEMNRTASKLIPAGPDRITTLRGNISIPRLQGQTATAFKGDDGNFALITADPTNFATLRFLAASVNNTVETVQYTMDVKLLYSVEFFDRKSQFPSS